MVRTVHNEARTTVYHGENCAQRCADGYPGDGWRDTTMRRQLPECGPERGEPLRNVPP